jgi:hypothetical protein
MQARHSRTSQRVALALVIVPLLGAAWYATQHGFWLSHANWLAAMSDRLLGAPAQEQITPELRDGDTVITAVRNLARLETLSFHMERVIDLKDTHAHAFGMLKAQDAILLVAAGDVTAGVDLTKIREGDISVDVAKQSVRLRVPPAEIFSVSLDSGRTYVYSRQTSLFTRPATDLEARARREAEAAIKRAALEGGVLTRAGANAEQTLSALVRSLGYAHVELIEHE